MFSTDGKQIVYNDFPSSGDASGGHKLTVMDFNASTKTFSNARTLFTDANKYPGWPFFTPDGKQVIFSLGVAPNFASEPSPPQFNAGSAQLYVVDVASKTAHRLDETSGYSGSTEYLPFPGRDENLDFFPTVNPLSAGGYFWVYFTSRRQYGNMVQNGSVPGKDDVASKSIWVSAIDINPTPGSDPSHPAFYLPGQELGSGNIRAFSVLAPCKGDGSGCESGIDCCGGSCTSGKCGAPAACADENSKCSATIPCCISGDECIGGYCGVAPPK
jgi:WD40-like Beta Propeller Repeat